MLMARRIERSHIFSMGLANDEPEGQMTHMRQASLVIADALQTRWFQEVVNQAAEGSSRAAGRSYPGRGDGLEAHRTTFMLGMQVGLAVAARAEEVENEGD